MFFLNRMSQSFGNFIGMLIFFLFIYKSSFQMSHTFMRILTLALLCKVQYFSSFLLLTFLSVLFAMQRFLILLPLNMEYFSITLLTNYCFIWKLFYFSLLTLYPDILLNFLISSNPSSAALEFYRFIISSANRYSCISSFLIFRNKLHKDNENSMKKILKSFLESIYHTCVHMDIHTHTHT